MVREDIVIRKVGKHRCIIDINPSRECEDFRRAWERSCIHCMRLFIHEEPLDYVLGRVCYSMELGILKDVLVIFSCLMEKENE